MLKEYLYERNISINNTGIAYSTVNYIVNQRTPIEKCTGETIYRIAKYLQISMDHLYEMNKRFTLQDFEVFKSEVTHTVKTKTGITFLLETIQSDTIEQYWARHCRVQALYLLSMVDYLSRINNVPLCSKYNEIRKARIEPMIFPLSVKLQTESVDEETIDSSQFIPEFWAHGIAEGDVMNVY